MSKKMETPEFWRGQSFEIQTDDKKIYFTQMNDDGEMLVIQRPADRDGRLMPLAKALPVTVFFFDVDQQGLFTFKSKLTAQSETEYLLEKPEQKKIEKAQRRRFFRVKIGVRMDISLPSKSNPKQTETYHLHTHDISGGGLSFLNPHKLAENGEMAAGKLFLKTDTYETEVPFHANVVSVAKTDRDVFRMALEFKDMKETERGALIKYCMFKQVELRNKMKNSI